jgi:hypothetical protein
LLSRTEHNQIATSKKEHLTKQPSLLWSLGLRSAPSFSHFDFGHSFLGLELGRMWFLSVLEFTLFLEALCIAVNSIILDIYHQGGGGLAMTSVPPSSYLCSSVLLSAPEHRYENGPKLLFH